MATEDTRTAIEMEESTLMAESTVMVESTMMADTGRGTLGVVAGVSAGCVVAVLVILVVALLVVVKVQHSKLTSSNTISSQGSHAIVTPDAGKNTEMDDLNTPHEAANPAHGVIVSTNPAYGVGTDGVAVSTNPAYGVGTDGVAVSTNPAYGVGTDGVAVSTNPAYGVSTHGETASSTSRIATYNVSMDEYDYIL